ncbi:hypothetical protein D3C73_1031330 [compost metagenome]
MRHRLESFLIKTVRNDTDIARMVDIWRQILGERAGYRHQTVAYKLKLTIYRHQKAVLKPALLNRPVQNQLTFITGVKRLDQGNVRIDFFHRKSCNRMMGMNQIIPLVHPQLRPPDIIAVGLDIFLHNRTFAVLCPVERLKDNLFASLPTNPLGQPEQIHIPAAGVESLLQVRNHGRYATGLLRREE